MLTFWQNALKFFKKGQQEHLLDFPRGKTNSIHPRKIADWFSQYGIQTTKSDMQLSQRTLKELKKELTTFLKEKKFTSSNQTRLSPHSEMLAYLIGKTPNQHAFDFLADNLDETIFKKEALWLRTLEFFLLDRKKLPVGILFHRRSLHSLGELLWRCQANIQNQSPDIIDKLLIESLILFWQRRRPTSEVRANRKILTPRRKTPKPALKALDQEILFEGLQLDKLIGLLDLVEPSIREDFTLLLMEIYLFFLHLKSHVPSKKKQPKKIHEKNDQELFDKIIPKIDSEEEKAFIQFRWQMMHAYDKEAHAQFPNPKKIIEKHPYVRCTMLFNQDYLNGTKEARKKCLDLGKDWEGRAAFIGRLEEKL